VVIEPTALFQGLVELLLLLLGGVETVFVHFQHMRIVGQTQQECKREIVLHLPQTRNAAFIPMNEFRGFQRRRLVNLCYLKAETIRNTTRVIKCHDE
jgi:hypothetical protein